MNYNSKSTFGKPYFLEEIFNKYQKPIIAELALTSCLGKIEAINTHIHFACELFLSSCL